MRTILALVLLIFSAPSLFAHCDALDGPVVAEANAALDAGDVTPLLKWVSPAREAEVKTAFDRAVAGQATRMHFLETLVRVHREGEGAPFTGIKPAGQIPPAIAAADRALASGSIEEVEEELMKKIRAGLHARFEEALSRRSHSSDSVDAGRMFVEAYVEYIHFAERLHEAATRAAHGAEHEH